MERTEETRAPVRLMPETWREAEGGRAELIAVRCRSCGTHYLPHFDLCPACLSHDLDQVVLSPVGKLYSYSIVHVPPAGYPPVYTIGYVDYPEGVRVFGQVKATSSAEVTPDMPVRTEVAEIRREADGTPVLGFRFVRA